MPFFLVTHTSLVEADNETSAAEKAVGDVRSGHQLTVMVKADEHTVTQVTVAADYTLQRDDPDNTGCNGGNDEDLMPENQAVEHFEKLLPGKERSGQQQWAGKVVGIGVFAALSILLFVLATHGEWSS